MYNNKKQCSRSWHFSRPYIYWQWTWIILCISYPIFKNKESQTYSPRLVTPTANKWPLYKVWTFQYVMGRVWIFLKKSDQNTRMTYQSDLDIYFHAWILLRHLFNNKTWHDMSIYMQINVDFHNLITYSTPTSVNTHSAQTSLEIYLNNQVLYTHL